MIGQRFRLTVPALATTAADTAVMIPAGAEIVVIEGGSFDEMNVNQKVTVKWEGNPVTMFAGDIHDRGERLV